MQKIDEDDSATTTGSSGSGRTSGADPMSQLYSLSSSNMYHDMTPTSIASLDADTSGVLRTPIADSLQQEGLTSLFASLAAPTKEPVYISKRILPESQIHEGRPLFSPLTDVHRSQTSDMQHSRTCNYGPTGYQLEQYQLLNQKKCKEAGGQLHQKQPPAYMNMEANARKPLEEKSSGISNPSSFQYRSYNSEAAVKPDEEKEEEFYPRRMTGDPLIPCAQWQNMCRDFRNKLLSGHSSSVLLREFEKLDIYYKTTVSVLQHEIYLLDRQVCKMKTCCHCGERYSQQYNDKVHCLYHRSSPFPIESFCCTKCGGYQNVYACCQQCGKCSRGCILSRHCSYD